MFIIIFCCVYNAGGEDGSFEFPKGPSGKVKLSKAPTSSGKEVSRAPHLPIFSFLLLWV